MLRNRTPDTVVAPAAGPRPLGVRLPVLFVVFAAVLVVTGRAATAAAGHAGPGLLVGGACAAAALTLYGFLVRRLERCWGWAPSPWPSRSSPSSAGTG
jgi:hypothetical protein